MTKYEIPIESKTKKSARIPIDKLHDFEGHPYKVTDNEDNHQSRESFAPLDSYKVLNDGYTSSLRSRHKKQVPSKDSLRRLYRFDEVFRSVFEQDAMFPNQRLLPACFQTLPAYREY